MEHLYTTYSERLKRNGISEAAKRNLKRLKIALTVWVISFLATIIWFSLIA